MKHRKLPLPLTFFLMLLLLQIPLALGSSLSWLLTVAVHETLGYLVLLLFESAGLLLLFLALGMSFGAVYERRYGRAFGFIALASLSTILGTVLSLILQALFFRQTVEEDVLARLLGSALDAAILPFFGALLLAYFVFLRRGADIPRSARATSSVTLRAIILANSALFAYRLLGQILYAVNFVNDSFGFTFLKPEEKLTLILDFIPVFGVAVASYYLLLWSFRLYLRILKARADV